MKRKDCCFCPVFDNTWWVESVQPNFEVFIEIIKLDVYRFLLGFDSKFLCHSENYVGGIKKGKK